MSQNRDRSRSRQPPTPYYVPRRSESVSAGHHRDQNPRPRPPSLMEQVSPNSGPPHYRPLYGRNYHSSLTDREAAKEALVQSKDFFFDAHNYMFQKTPDRSDPRPMAQFGKPLVQPSASQSSPDTSRTTLSPITSPEAPCWEHPVPEPATVSVSAPRSPPQEEQILCFPVIWYRIVDGKQNIF